METYTYHFNPVTRQTKNCSSVNCAFEEHFNDLCDVEVLLENSQSMTLKGKLLIDVIPSFVKGWLLPENALAQSGILVSLFCPKGHENNVRPKHWVKSLVCSICFTKDRSVLYTNFADEFSNRNTLKADEVSRVEKRIKYIWECSSGHEFEQTPWHRLREKWGCPWCGKKKFDSKINSISVTNPEILGEWDYPKNDSIGVDPSNITSGSKIRVHWICKKFGHSWKARPNDRLNVTKSGCHHCAGSKMENDVASFVEEILKSGSNNASLIRNDRKFLKGKELDFYLPDLNIAIEFNGDYFHSTKFLKSSYNISAEDYHNNKRDLCEEAGVTLAFVWESDWLYKTELVKESIIKFIETGLLTEDLKRITSVRD